MPERPRRRPTHRTPHPRDVDPALLERALRGQGWRVAGFRKGLYARLWWPGEHSPRGRSLIVPLDRTAPDFDTTMAGTLMELADAADLGGRADSVLNAVAAGAVEERPEDPDPLDYAMFEVWINGNWRFLTSKMSQVAKEAALAAVLRHGEWLHQADGEQPVTRESVAWWESV